MSSSNCHFLTCIQVSQEAGQVVWYAHLFQDFPQFIVIHTVKGFDIVNKAFSMILWILVIWSLVPLPFLKPAWTSGSSQFTYCWSLAWRIVSITLLVCEMSAIVREFEYSLALPFFGIGMKTDFFQSCGHCWVFQVGRGPPKGRGPHPIISVDIHRLTSVAGSILANSCTRILGRIRGPFRCEERYKTIGQRPTKTRKDCPIQVIYITSLLCSSSLRAPTFFSRCVLCSVSELD